MFTNKGFTLIELLIVIAIIGILSTLTIVSLANVRTKSRDSKRLADIQQISKALELYYADQGYYPTFVTPGQSIKSPDDTKVYMSSVPNNPSPRNDGLCLDNNYIYTVDSQSNPSAYNISTCLGSGTQILQSGAVAYSTAGLFNCGQKIVDSDGNSYNTVQIGSQCWMKENLNVGTMVAGSGNQTDVSDPRIVQKYCYGDDSTKCNTYGGLYQWHTAMAFSQSCDTVHCSPNTIHRGICPVGWHIPTEEEFNTLEKYTISVINSSSAQYPCDLVVWWSWKRCADNDGTDAGGSKGVGKSLKAIGQGSGIGAGDDLVGFSALLAGIRNGGSFAQLNSYTYFWHPTPDAPSSADINLIYTSFSTVYRGAANKTAGLSIRCIKD